jgi:ubiquinone/menaquinone biosynthesis C-methylase UbiE
MGLIARCLWWIYGHTYDGLLDFYPYQSLIGKVVKKADIQTGQTVLDLGCGTGNALVRIAGTADVTMAGVDNSSSMLARVRRKMRTQIEKGSLTLEQSDILPYLRRQPDAAFDRIVTINVIYALSNRIEIWPELLRVLKPDGLITAATSVRTGSGTIMKEHFEHVPVWRSIKPGLIGVFLVDSAINSLGNAGQFEFPNERVLRKEVAAAGGIMSATEPCYGGVDILFTVKHS